MRCEMRWIGGRWIEVRDAVDWWAVDCGERCGGLVGGGLRCAMRWIGLLRAEEEE